MKDKLAQIIAGKLSIEQKRQVIQAFYDTHKQDPNIDDLVQDMKKALNYFENDVPKK